MGPLDVAAIAPYYFSLVPPTRLELAQPLRAKGFSYHYSFHYQITLMGVTSPTAQIEQLFVVWTLS